MLAQEHFDPTRSPSGHAAPEEIGVFGPNRTAEGEGGCEDRPVLGVAGAKPVKTTYSCFFTLRSAGEIVVAFAAEDHLATIVGTETAGGLIPGLGIQTRSWLHTNYAQDGIPDVARTEVRKCWHQTGFRSTLDKFDCLCDQMPVILPNLESVSAWGYLGDVKLNMKDHRIVL